MEVRVYIEFKVCDVESSFCSSSSWRKTERMYLEMHSVCFELLWELSVRTGKEQCWHRNSSSEV